MKALLPLLRQAAQFARAPHALRWRLETFGLYMPSLPEARPWWRVNARAARALLAQLPGYARWLAGMRALSRQGASGWWHAHSDIPASSAAQKWEEWLALSETND